MTWKLFVGGEEDADCMAEELEGLNVDPCDQPATSFAEDDESGTRIPLCYEHKEAAKAAGIAS